MSRAPSARSRETQVQSETTMSAEPPRSATLPASGLAPRTLQRRIVRATGLTPGSIRQIRRAQRAVELLSQGMRPLEVAHHAGYADQSHLTRSLRRFVGRTPAQIVGSICGG